MPNLTVDGLTLIVLVVLPGMVAIKVYDLLHPPDKRNWNDSIAEAILFSALNLVVWLFPFLVWYGCYSCVWTPQGLPDVRQLAQQDPIKFCWLAIFMLFCSPAVLAYWWARLKNTQWFGLRYGYPAATAWDDFFKRKQECWVFARLKAGGSIGGFFGVNSYVTSFPHTQEIYIEEAWKTDEGGKFVAKVEGTLGIFIRASECETIEFFKASQEEGASRDGGNQSREVRRTGDSGTGPTDRPGPAGRRSKANRAARRRRRSSPA